MKSVRNVCIMLCIHAMTLISALILGIISIIKSYEGYNTAAVFFLAFLLPLVLVLICIILDTKLLKIFTDGEILEVPNPKEQIAYKRNKKNKVENINIYLVVVIFISIIEGLAFLQSKLIETSIIFLILFVSSIIHMRLIKRK